MYYWRIDTFSRYLTSYPYPRLSHSFVTIVVEADLAEGGARVSVSVCLQNEKSLLAPMLTPGIARVSRAMRDNIGN